jgi:uncharacterized repeat protein (TIGR03803 family)
MSFLIRLGNFWNGHASWKNPAQYKLGRRRNIRQNRHGRNRLPQDCCRLEVLEDRWLPSLSVTASFGAPNGVYPLAGLLMDSRGNLFGTTSAGGTFGMGTVFEVPAGSTTITTLASFNGTNGASPEGTLIEDKNGNLFGTTLFGGSADKGTVFELSAGSGTIKTLASFSGSNGALPSAGVVEDSSGDLFGTTELGGASNDGTVFEIPAASRTLFTLASFNYASNGSSPNSLIMDNSGNLFGTAASGGSSKYGTVFEIPTGIATIMTLASFDIGTSGSAPTGVLEDSTGNLFGTTTAGGLNNYGTVFELSAGGGTITTLASLPAGASAYGRLVRDSGGNLFGTTSPVVPGQSQPNVVAPPNGTVFELPAGSRTITTLASFQGAKQSEPVGSLVEDSSGNLFGTTYLGGTAGDGSLFELPAGSGAITTVASFTFPGGIYPDAGMVIDHAGNLFGTATQGGANNDGTVFELPAASDAITPIASFNGTNGSNPQGTLVENSSGDLFGTTVNGGSANVGTVFEVFAGSGTVTTLASFNGSNGENPSGGLALDKNGDLFGSTKGGGASGDGTIFKVLAGSGNITILASFDGSNGSGPNGVISDKQGNLFGTTASGTIFEVKAGSGTITTLVSTGESIASDLVEDGSGNLYGTTGGEAFELPAGSRMIRTLASFPFQSSSYSTLAIDARGDLFGTLSAAAPGQRGPVLGGGSAGDVFEIPARSNTIIYLGSFPNPTGNHAEPDGNLVEDSSGNLFGTSYFEGISGSGTVFKIPSRMPATVSLSSATNPASPDQSVTFSATVRGVLPAGPTPTGPVVFLDGTTVLGTWNLTSQSEGVAVFTTPPLSIGTHSITGRYLGNANYLDNTSPVLIETINAPVTNPNLAFLQQVYADLLHRGIDPSGQATWTGLLNSGVPRPMVVYMIETSTSQEYQTDEVKQSYELLLHRNADPSGMRTGLYIISTFGLQAEDAFIAGSPEYLQDRGGGSISGWLTAIYSDGFNRTIDPSGQSSFSQALSSGALTFQQAASIIFTSPEYYQDLVGGYYSTFLRRDADAAGLASWVSQLLTGQSPEQIIAGILGASEYFTLAQSLQ